jgi:hypothetical protein
MDWAEGRQGKKEASSTFVLPAITSICTYNVGGIKGGNWALVCKASPKSEAYIHMHVHHADHVHLPIILSFINVCHIQHRVLIILPPQPINMQQN